MDDVARMIGYRPFPWMKWCWSFITPCVCLVRPSRDTLSPTHMHPHAHTRQEAPPPLALASSCSHPPTDPFLLVIGQLHGGSSRVIRPLVAWMLVSEVTSRCCILHQDTWGRCFDFFDPTSF